MRISDWSSDVCSSDLRRASTIAALSAPRIARTRSAAARLSGARKAKSRRTDCSAGGAKAARAGPLARFAGRSEEHTSELQSLMRISYAVFCLQNKKQNQKNHRQYIQQHQIQKT